MIIINNNKISVLYAFVIRKIVLFFILTNKIIHTDGKVLGCLGWEAFSFILPKTKSLSCFIVFLILSPNYTRYTTWRAVGKV